MALRLPDIPFESWIADQQDRLQRLTESALPSLEFRAAALDAESKIPAYGAETDMALAEEMALQQEQERQRQQQEEEARRAAEEQRRQQAEFAQQQAAQAEAERQRGFMEEAWSTAKSLGIPTPGDVYDYFTGANSRPVGVGDNESSAGTFDSQPADMGGFAPEPTLPYADPTQVQSSDDFLAQTQSLNDSVFGPPDTAAPINGPELPPSDTPVYDAIINTGRNALETARRGLEMSSPSASIAFNAATGAGEAVVDAANRLSPSYMATNVGVVKGLGKTWNEADRQSIAESLTETPEETRAKEELLVPGSPALSRALHLAKDLAEDVLESKAITDITGSIWRENNLPMVYWGNDGFYVGKEKKSSEDVEINPGEFFAPDRLGFGGAVVPAMERQGVQYGLGAAGAVERAAGGALRATGSAIGRTVRGAAGEIADTAGAITAPIGRGLREADRALGSLFTRPDEEARAASSGLGLHRTEEMRPGFRRMYHGGTVGLEDIDPEQMSDGLYGPAHYLSSNPRVAESYFGFSGQRATDEAGGYAIEGAIRPADIPNDALLFNADAAVPKRDVQRIVNVLRTRAEDDPIVREVLPDYEALLQHPIDQWPVIPGRRFYNDLSLDVTPENRWRQVQEYGQLPEDVGDKAKVNAILSEAGFDGVRYRGEPVKDLQGQPAGPHDAVAIFPDKLDRIRNAFTGEARGNVSAIGESPRAIAQLSTAERFENAARGMLPTHTATGAALGGTTGGTAGAAAGWNSAPEDAPFSEKLDRATQGFMAGAILGSGVGAGAAAAANIAGSKIVKRAFLSGALDFDMMSSHPNFENRMKAIMLLAARDKADDEIVELPPAATYRLLVDREGKGSNVDEAMRRLGLGETDPETGNLIFRDLTAGQIRERYRRTPVQELGRAANELFVDALTGSASRHGRGRETRADIAGVIGEFPVKPNLTANEVDEGIGSRVLLADQQAFEVVPEAFHNNKVPPLYGEVRDMVREVARRFGVPEPRVYIVDSDRVNAYAIPKTGARPVIGITKGLANLDVTDDEFYAVVAHELSHATDADRGRSLLEPTQAFIDRLTRNVKQKVDDWRGRTPDEFVDDIEDDFGGPPPDEGAIDIPDEYIDDAYGGAYDDFEPLTRKPRTSLTDMEQAIREWFRSLDGKDPTPDDIRLLSDDELEVILRDVSRGNLYPDDEDIPNLFMDEWDRRGLDEAGAPDLPSYDSRASNDLTSGQPSRGIWADRLNAGPDIPDGLGPSQVRNIERAFNEVKRLIARSQGERKTSQQMKFRRMADEAWATYQGMRERYLATVPPDQRPRVERSVRTPRDAGTTRPTAGTPEPEPRVDSGVVRGPEGGEVPDRVGSPEPVEPRPAPQALEDFTPEPEPLPETMDRSRVFSLEETKSIINQAKDEASADTATVKAIDGAAGRLMTLPKITGRNIESFLNAIGERRKIPNRETADQWTDRFLRKNGWLAPLDEKLGVDETVLSRRRAGDMGTATPEPGAESTPLGEGVGEGTDRGVQNLQGGAVGALAGAADPTAQDEDEEYETPIDRMAAGAVLGILGRRKVLPSLQKGAGHPLATSARKRAFTNPTPGKAPEAGLAERIWYGITTRWTDDLSRLQQYQKDLAKEWEKQMGSKLPTSVLAAELKRLDPTRSAEMLVDERLKPHLKTFVRLGIPDEDINTYIANVHDIDIANATGNPGRTFPGGGGVADAIRDNQKFIAALKNDLTPAEFQEFEQSVQGVWDMGDTILKMKRDAGLITDEAYQTLRAEYPRYVPTRILDYINDENRVGFGKSLSITSNTIHEIGQQGTSKDALMPLPALLGATYEAQVAAQKNTVFQAFIGMAAYANRLPTSVSGAALTERSQQRMRELTNGVTPLSSLSAKVPKGQVPVQGFINGQKVAFAVDKQLGDVVRFQSPITIPIFTGLMHAFRAGATARNPVFLTANLFLDLSSYMVREAARAGGPQKIPEVLSVYAATLNEFLLQPDAWKWIAAHEYRGDMARFLREGGGSSGQVGRGALRPDPTYWKQVDDLAKTMGFRQQGELENEIGRLTREGWTPLSARTPAEALKMIGDIVTLKPVEAIGERIELVPRVAAMRMAERRGANQLESVIAGRTTTIDFNKGGSWARTINQMIPFFNVGMQAVADIPRAYQENPAAWSATVAAAVIAPMAIAEAWNNSTDQMRQDYKDVPDYIKDQGLVVMMPHGMKIGDFTVPDAPVDAQGNRRPQFFHFRFRQLAPVAQMTRRTLQDWVPGWKNDVPEAERRTLYDEIMSGVSAISPVGANSPTDLVTSLTPLGIQTALQLAMDWDSYRGKRIRSTYADERSSPLSQGISRLSQGTFAEMTPAQAEFATRDIGSGYAGMLHGASEILFGKEKEGDRVLQDVPLAGGLASRFVKSSIGGNAESARESTLTDSSEKILRKHDIRWRPSPADPEINHVPLLRGEYATYQRMVNKETDRVIRELEADPAWNAMKKVDKEATIEREVTRARSAVRAEFIDTIPDAEWNTRLQKQYDEDRIATPVESGGSGLKLPGTSRSRNRRRVGYAR